MRDGVPWFLTWPRWSAGRTVQWWCVGCSRPSRVPPPLEEQSKEKAHGTLTHTRHSPKHSAASIIWTSITQTLCRGQCTNAHTSISNLDYPNSRLIRQRRTFHLQQTLSTGICYLPLSILSTHSVGTSETPSGSITRKLNMIWRRNLHQSTSLIEVQKALEAYGCKPWVTN